MSEWIKNHWKSILIVVLILIIIGLFLYYRILPEYNQKIAKIGYDTAVFDVFQLASQCQQVPVTYNNQTINLISMECLQNQ